MFMERKNFVIFRKNNSSLVESIAFQPHPPPTPSSLLLLQFSDLFIQLAYSICFDNYLFKIKKKKREEKEEEVTKNNDKTDDK